VGDSRFPPPDLRSQQEFLAMFRISACFVTVLSGLLVFGLMGARQGGADSTPQGRKIPSSVGRLLNASPKENAERAALLERLERPISISVEEASLRECISKVLATLDTRTRSPRGRRVAA
jgi:hypothetical protein